MRAVCSAGQRLVRMGKMRGNQLYCSPARKRAHAPPAIVHHGWDLHGAPMASTPCRAADTADMLERQGCILGQCSGMPTSQRKRARACCRRFVRMASERAYCAVLGPSGCMSVQACAPSRQGWRLLWRSLAPTYARKRLALVSRSLAKRGPTVRRYKARADTRHDHEMVWAFRPWRGRIRPYRAQHCLLQPHRQQRASRRVDVRWHGHGGHQKQSSLWRCRRAGAIN